MQILTQYEREQIGYSLKLKRSIRTIADVLGRDHSVIVRELKRNRNPDGAYDPLRALWRADRRARKTNKRKLESNEDLHDWVERKLRQGSSPELVAGRLKAHPPKELNGARVSHEQIYRYIYEGPGRFEVWYQWLIRKHPKRQQQRGRKPRKTKIPERISIHDRPAIVDGRGRVGDWEADLALYRNQRSALAVQYERATMSIRLQKVPNRTAEEHGQALTRTFEAVPPELRQTVTFDNGTENVCHQKIRDAFHLDTFFCDPYSAWQKGGVENAVGLVRRYLPKQTDLDTVSAADLRLIEDRLNDRPRKRLNYQTPHEAWGGALNS